MTTARHRCFSLLMAKDQFTSYIPTSRYDSTYRRTEYIIFLKWTAELI